MSFPWTSSIDVDTTRPAIQSEPLVLTTGGAWEETGNLYLVPREMSEYAPENPGMHVLAVLQTGVLPSAFAPALSDADARAHREAEIPAAELAGARGQAEGEARVLVVSNALFLSDFYMGYTNAIGNYHFIMNALDYLALDSSLIDVRSRLITEAPLDEEKAAEWKTPVVVANMVLAPLVLVILGIVAGLRRRTREAQT